MALWCSRLARQPVTLEVDGSSPFGVAKNNTIHLDGVIFLFFKNGLEQSNAIVRWTIACPRLDGDYTLICAMGANVASPFGGAISSKLATSPFEITFSSQQHTKSPDFRPGFHFTEYVLLPCNP